MSDSIGRCRVLFTVCRMLQRTGTIRLPLRLCLFQNLAFHGKYNFKVPAGAFGENLLVEGIDLKNLPIGTRLKVNDILLEITQIGKKCHLGCNIQKQTGECIMPNEGVFAIVLNGGEIKAQDTIFVEA